MEHETGNIYEDRKHETTYRLSKSLVMQAYHVYLSPTPDTKIVAACVIESDIKLRLKEQDCKTIENRTTHNF